jgi:hypothetical protein
VWRRNRLEARAAGSAPEADAVAAALRPVLPGMLAATATAGGCTQEVTAGAGGLPVFICDPSLAAEALCCRRLPALGSPPTLQSPHDLTVTGR